MKKQILNTIAVACFSLIAAVSFGQEAKPVKEDKVKKQKKFGKIDTDKSQTISFTEYQTYRLEARNEQAKDPKKGNLEKRFKQIDANGDGMLDRAEFKNRKATKPEKKKKEKVQK